MTNRLDHIAELRDALVKLEHVPKDKAEAKVWYEAARQLEIELRKNGLLVEVPEWFRHYLIDVDIRMKDLEYANLQARQLAKFIAVLDQGRIPVGADLNVDQ